MASAAVSPPASRKPKTRHHCIKQTGIHVPAATATATPALTQRDQLRFQAWRKPKKAQAARVSPAGSGIANAIRAIEGRSDPAKRKALKRLPFRPTTSTQDGCVSNSPSLPLSSSPRVLQTNQLTGGREGITIHGAPWVNLTGSAPEELAENWGRCTAAAASLIQAPAG